MRIGTSTSARWLRCASLALVSISPGVLALGLGGAQAESFLSQPLDASIELIAGPDEDLTKVTVGLASAEDFALIGADREALSVPLRFALETDGAEPRIRVTSDLPVNDPVIRLIVEVNWPRGRMLREYTLLLDPPTVPAAPPAPVVDQRSGAAPAAAPGTALVTAPQAVPASPVAAGEGGVYGPVRSGENLWRIATDWARGTGLDTNQVMLAIQRNNPEAFIDDNINLLKRGAILRLPRVAEVTEVPVALARAEVLAQEAARRQSIVPAVETPLIDAAAEPPLAPSRRPAPAPAAELEIVPPVAEDAAPDAAGSAAGADTGDTGVPATLLREELARTEEELLNERQENVHLRDRVAALERALAESEAATVEDAALAATEQRLREERESAAAQAAGPAADRTVPQVHSDATPQPWYRSLSTWLVLLVVVGAGVAGWLLSRRPAASRGALAAAEPGSAVRHIQDEAEELLQVLRPAAEQGTEGAEAAAALQAGRGGRRAASGRGGREEEAAILDEASEDPEVRLDLARAYISMGDREAARVILKEVIEQGDETQQTEARAMLGEL